MESTRNTTATLRAMIQSEEERLRRSEQRIMDFIRQSNQYQALNLATETTKSEITSENQTDSVSIVYSDKVTRKSEVISKNQTDSVPY